MPWPATALSRCARRRSPSGARPRPPVPASPDDHPRAPVTPARVLPHVIRSDTMAKVLFIEASPRKGRSYSTQAAAHFIKAYKAAHPGDTVEVFDLWKA
ncbi:MAG: NAD(P)H-dependent oxidoreductase, partial [Oceanibaculum sp.]